MGGVSDVIDEAVLEVVNKELKDENVTAVQAEPVATPEIVTESYTIKAV